MTLSEFALGGLLALLSSAMLFKIWRVQQALSRIDGKLSRFQRESQNEYLQGEVLNGL